MKCFLTSLTFHFTLHPNTYEPIVFTGLVKDPRVREIQKGLAALHFVYFNPKLLAASHKRGDARSLRDNKKRKYMEQFAQERADVYFLLPVWSGWS
jgi:hypothetical protein